MRKFFGLLVMAGFLLGLSVQSDAQEKIPAKQGVYEFVLTTSVSFSDAIPLLQKGIEESSFRLATTVRMKSPGDCAYRSAVFVLYDSTYAGQLLDINPLTAPFALVDRINLFEDENGVHVSVVNTVSINRTVLLDDEKYLRLSADHLQALRELIVAALPGKLISKQYGPFRKKGYIGRTMGVMAGGPFDEKIQTVAELEGADWEDVVKKLEMKMKQPGKKWGLHLAYTIVLPNRKIAILGTTGPGMESRSFSIVGAGSDRDRKKYKCPGIAHAGAYPIEVVVRQEGNEVKVQVVDAMYRMKMYFEDAGKWAFAKNMTMPGSIQSEIEDQIKSALVE